MNKKKKSTNKYWQFSPFRDNYMKNSPKHKRKHKYKQRKLVLHILECILRREIGSFFISRLFLAQQLDQWMVWLTGCPAWCWSTPHYFPPGLTTLGLVARTGDFQSVVQKTLSHGKMQISLLEAKDFLLPINNPVQLQQRSEQDMTS